MVLQSSGPIKFSQIKAEFNPTGSDSLIRLSNYNNSKTHYYGSLPSPNSRISLNNFYGISSIKYGNNYIAIIENNNLQQYILINNGEKYYTYTNTGNYVNKLLFNSNIYCSILSVGGGAPLGGPSSRFAKPSVSGGAGGNVNYISSYLFYANTSYDVFVGNSQNASYITSNNNNFFYANGGTKRLDFFAGGTNTQFYKNNILINTYTGVIGYSSGSDDIGGGGSGAGGNANGKNGGIGYLSTITGNSQYYGGGGAGYQIDVHNNVFLSSGSFYGGVSCAYGGGGGINGDDNIVNPQNGCVIISENRIFQEIYVNGNQVDWIYNYNLSIKYYIFLNNNTNSIKFFGSTVTGKLLIVGGGGAGGFYQFINPGYYYAGGGGGGFVYYNNSFTFLTGTYIINVGNYGNQSIITLPSNTTIIAAAGQNAKSPSGVVRPTIGGNSGSTIIINGISSSYTYSGGNQTYTPLDPVVLYTGGSGAGASGNGINGPQQSVTIALGGPGYTSDITGTNVIYSPGGNGSDTNNNSTNYGAGGNSTKSGNPGCVIIALPI